MGKINVARVVAGGLLAGLVINLGESLFNAVLFAKEMAAAIEELKRPPIGGQAIAYFVVLGFALGIVTVWLYAAIRPRFGAGPKTAVCAGLFAWALAYAYPSIGMLVMGLFPTRLLLIGLVWGLFEVPIASVVGAWAYREEAA